MLRRFEVLAALLLPALVLGGGRSAEAQWGTLSGRVTVTGEVPAVGLLYAKGDEQVREPICRAHDIADESLVVDADTKGLANVFIFLPRAPDRIHPGFSSEPDELVFDQDGCRFVPHAMVVRTDQTVLVKSNDPVLHNTHTFPTFNEPRNQALPPKDREGVPFTFRRRESSPVQVKCDLHPWMSAWWLVVDHPYAAMSDEQGRFTIENLPVGEHTFRVWQERAGWIDKKLKVEIRDGQTTETSVEVPAHDLSKR